MVTPKHLAFIVVVFASQATAQSPHAASCATSAPLHPALASVSHGASGPSVAIVDSATLATLGGRTLSEVLTARIPGVSVMRSSGVAGTGSRIRLRGPSGLVVPQQPLLYLNGIRVDGEAQSIVLDAGGQAPSRIDDIAVEDVQCIYVLRGPATTAAYGTDAAGGVIHVITRAGDDSVRADGFLEGGAAMDVADYPANFGTCPRWRAATGGCATTATRSFSPIEANTPFRTAPTLRGGGSATVIRAPQLSLRASATGQTDNGALRRNDHSRLTFGLNGAFRPAAKFDVGGDLWVLNNRTDLPQVGPFIYSILNSALLGSSMDDPERRGYRTLPLSLLEEFGVEQRSFRLGGTMRVRWAPSPWLTIGALVGREDSRVREEQADPTIRQGIDGLEVLPNSPITEGDLKTERTTGAVSAVATFGPTTFRSATALRIDRLTESYSRTTRTFDPTGQFPGESFSFSEFEPSMTGLTVSQSIASSDRRFVQVGVRRDALGSAFGELNDPTYVFASAAWELGRELEFAPGGVVSSLRLRGAYGEAGDTRPFDGLNPTFTTPEPVSESPRVERTREIEGGIDLGLLGAISAAATLFEKRTTEGLMEVPTPPGIGGLPSSYIRNGAEWRTRGSELDVRARLFERRSVSASLSLTYTSSKNEVITLGGAPPNAGTAFRITPDYPLYGLWGRPFTVTDANGDGVIVPAEVVAASEPRFLGSPVPTRELGIAPTITLGGAMTIAALVDYRGGFRIDNAGGRIRCNANCFALYDPAASPRDQARAVDPNDAREAWIEDGSFTRLRELSVAWRIPRSWARGIGARSATLTALGRNLWTGTDYSGLDPEVSSTGQSAILQSEFFTVPLARTLSLRLDARW